METVQKGHWDRVQRQRTDLEKTQEVKDDLLRRVVRNTCALKSGCKGRGAGPRKADTEELSHE